MACEEHIEELLASVAVRDCAREFGERDGRVGEVVEPGLALLLVEGDT